MTESRALVAALFVMMVGVVCVVDALGVIVGAIGEVGTVVVCTVGSVDGVCVVLLLGVALVVESVEMFATVGAAALLLATLAAGELFSAELVWTVAGSIRTGVVLSTEFFCSMGGK